MVIFRRRAIDDGATLLRPDEHIRRTPHRPNIDAGFTLSGPCAASGFDGRRNHRRVIYRLAIFTNTASCSEEQEHFVLKSAVDGLKAALVNLSTSAIPG
jgi:hypothetical protein